MDVNQQPSSSQTIMKEQAANLTRLNTSRTERFIMKNEHQRSISRLHKIDKKIYELECLIKTTSDKEIRAEAEKRLLNANKLYELIKHTTASRQKIEHRKLIHKRLVEAGKRQEDIIKASIQERDNIEKASIHESDIIERRAARHQGQVEYASTRHQAPSMFEE